MFLFIFIILLCIVHLSFFSSLSLERVSLITPFLSLFFLVANFRKFNVQIYWFLKLIILVTFLLNNPWI
jgi:hypothetical protein